MGFLEGAPMTTAEDKQPPEAHATELLDWRFYGVAAHRPERITALDIEPSGGDCLRMLISRNGGYTYALTPAYQWVTPAIEAALDAPGHTENPYVYLTVRHGGAWEGTDEWHVDGYSQRVPHVPEQNYVWCSANGTQWLDQRVRLPAGFDPMRDNIHKALQARIGTAEVAALDLRTLYRMTPYVIHRQPPGPLAPARVFLRVSFTPIPIHDMTNTQNPLMPQAHGYRDGVRDFRDGLR